MSAMAARRIKGGGIEIGVRDAAVVRQQAGQLDVLIRRPIPHDVVAALVRPQIVVGSGHRIAQKLLARRQAERHVGEQLAMDRRRDRVLGDERRATPHSRHRAARERAGKADARSSVDRRRRSGGRPPRFRRSGAPPPSVRSARSLSGPCRDGSARAERRRARRGRPAPRRSASAGNRSGPRRGRRRRGSAGVVTSTPRSRVSRPRACRVAISSGCATIPAPRPDNSLSTRSNMSTSQPRSRSLSPASSPLIEPPITRARRLAGSPPRCMLSRPPRPRCTLRPRIFRGELLAIRIRPGTGFAGKCFIY